ncbi:hypothetical protein L7F22_036962 [Adiantum nelumboides]|nr:hypothetical protein [Adiantum nelumboides]
MRIARPCRSNHGIEQLCSKTQLHQALKLAQNLAQGGEPLQTHELYCLLQGCIQKKDLVRGRQVHSLIRSSSLESNPLLSSHLIRLYDSCKSLCEANEVFDRILNPNVFAWSAIISAHAKFGDAEEAMELFCRMHSSGVQPDKYVFVALLKAFSNSVAVNHGFLIHSYLMESGLEVDLFICSILIDMYSNCGTLSDAHQVFDYLQSKDVVAWNALILGYAENGDGEKGIMLFKQMLLEGIEPNNASFLSVLRACSVFKSLPEGKKVHTSIMRSGLLFDQSLQNAFIDMYAKSGSLKLALQVFEELACQDVVAWNTVITSHCQIGRTQDALTFFVRMRQEGIKPNIMTWNTLIAGHSRCGHSGEALKLFDSMQQEGLMPDIVTWNSLLGGLSHHGESEEVLKVFYQMLKTDLKPSVATFLATLKACSKTASLFDGHNFHSYILENKLESDLLITASLVDMYANCRCLDHAFSVFKRVQAHNVFTWTALIAGLVHNNGYQRALDFFTIMQREGCKPNEVTFVSVFSACCGAGLVDEGYSYFTLMQHYYGISPTLEHYNCLVEMFGATGFLLEAKHMLLSIPFDYNIIGWTSLLSNCRTHKDIPIARKCLEIALAINAKHATLYVIMSDIYNDAGMTEYAEQMLSLKRLVDSQHKPPVNPQISNIF